MSASFMKVHEAILKVSAIKAIGDVMGIAVEGCCLPDDGLSHLGGAIRDLADDALAILEPLETALAAPEGGAA